MNTHYSDILKKSLNMIRHGDGFLDLFVYLFLDLKQCVLNTKYYQIILEYQIL